MWVLEMLIFWILLSLKKCFFFNFGVKITKYQKSEIAILWALTFYIFCVLCAVLLKTLPWLRSQTSATF